MKHSKTYLVTRNVVRFVFWSGVLLGFMVGAEALGRVLMELY